ncbi:MAG: addiction module protein [Gammaproteobacteria bacterium]|nr:addiction module protein [Gammaproteobacteria bacterium]MBU2182883.1 addiction module protein [Gammaproteobacteria bacterium]MBU2203471.1 addiction module protein [Gammaproteobacteria bacterium]
MIDVAKQLVAQALVLSAKERSQIADALLQSLNVTDTALDQMWAKEADARLAAYQRGELEALSVQQVLAKYKD